MKRIEKIRHKISPIFEEGENQGSKEVRVWPFFLWILISVAAGVYGRLLASDGYRLLIGLVCFFAMAAILYVPMVKLGKREHK